MTESRVTSFLQGGGEMGDLIRRRDWSATPLGPPARWPQSLKTVVAILLSSGYPMYVAWGRNFTQVYNDAYRPILGSTKHPAALGIGTAETFREIWDLIGPMFREVLDTGRASTYVDMLLLLDRHGFREECYFTFSYSAIPGDDGNVGGVLVTCLETTERVIRERRVRVLRELLENRAREDVRSIATGSLPVLASDPQDLPLVWLYEPETGEVLGSSCANGILPRGLDAAVEEVKSRRDVPPVGTVRVLDLAHPVLPATGADVEPVGRVACVGIAAPGQAAAELVLVAGLSARLAWGDEYEGFLRAIAANMGVVIAEAQALQHERRRAEALAEIDRAKTVFFSEVSHEFRTPIALMLGPLDDALAASGPETRENLLIAKRNTVRLLKLVNSLLDFSRIEAGRMQAQFESLDLAQYTAELASNFRSAIEKAGLELVVDCPPLATPVSVDAGMWEKIVLNLLSNALKHTFEGRIEVRLREDERHVRLEVCDTGVGIPASQQATIFERFRRVPNARSRTHEGSGIGLALVRELARMHGGDVSVESREGEGSTFTVVAEKAAREALAARAGPRAGEPLSLAAAAYVEEAMRWMPGEALDDSSAGAAREAPAADPGTRVLVVDDNADMREYLSRLLGRRWTLRSCSDGLRALETAREWQPDLILSDVMMPGLDGFGLIARLREDEATRAIPVILLSARAGEDARIEGIHAGADDYLVKPFTARDLYARIEGQLGRARARRHEIEERQRLSRLFEQAPVAIALLRGPRFAFATANGPYHELVGRKAPELLGKDLLAALPELEGQGIVELLEQVRSTRAPYVGESVPVVLERGGARQTGWFNFVYQPILDPRGEVEDILVVANEVTELARARSVAEAASRAKDEFLAMLGHELRNPLAPIFTALQILRLKSGGVTGAEHDIIERQVAHLMSLVDDLLDVSRVTQGKLELKRRRVELATVVAEAIERASPLLEARAHNLAVDVPSSGLAVDADPQRLAQVVTNLLTNAAKFTGNGGDIRIRARLDDGEVELSVSDNGVGIAPGQLGQVFEAFYQSQKSFERTQGGLGLGLAIVRNLVGLHGGIVRAESDGPGRGATFVVRLPRALGEDQPAASAGAGPGGGRAAHDVLIVDDNPDAGDTLAEIVRMKGHTPHVARDAPSALALVRKVRPHVAFLDLGLPAMSGYELAERLRELPGLRDVPLFAVSGYGQREDRERSARAGFRGHLVKPVSIDDIVGSLEEASASRT